MNLLSNPKWQIEAKTSLKFDLSLSIKGEAIITEYALLTTEGVLIGFGFDLNIENMTKDEIFPYLRKEDNLDPKNSLYNKIFKFGHVNAESKDNYQSPIVFLVSSNKIFFLPNGIRQTNLLAWGATEDINELIDQIHINYEEHKALTN